MKSYLRAGWSYFRNDSWFTLGGAIASILNIRSNDLGNVDYDERCVYSRIWLGGFLGAVAGVLFRVP